MSPLELVLVAVPLCGVPLVIVWAFAQRSRRAGACARVAQERGLGYRASMPELADAGLEVLPSFRACAPHIATKTEFLNVFQAFPREGWEAWALDFHTRGTPGTEGPMFHGTWVLLRMPWSRETPVRTRRRGGSREWTVEAEGKWIGVTPAQRVVRPLPPKEMPGFLTEVLSRFGPTGGRGALGEEARR